jgi:putative membrane protein
MNIAAKILTAIVALEHLWFMVLEMFLWTRPIGLKTFGTTPEFAEASSVLAANQGLYNGFLAAGLIWALTRKSDGFAVQVFLLSCVVVAGIYGGVTAKTSILFIQAAPALLALILAVLARRGVTAPGARPLPR